MVEAIEDHFVPVLVFNNQRQDAELLRSFGEPSWNNPVVRFLDHDRKDVIEREDGVWETGPLAARMIEALEAADRDVPDFLVQVAESRRGKYERASFAML